MGKGDKKTKKGKRFKASFGNARPRMAVVNRVKKNAPAKPAATATAAAPAEEKPKTAAKRAPRKKAESAE